MNVIADTCVWSEAFRKKNDHPVKPLFIDLLRNQRVILLGAVRQELLSGVRHPERFLLLRELMREFPDTVIQTDDHETAAWMSNTCRRAGIQGSQTDFLICAVAARLNAKILTLDRDFTHFSGILPIRLFSFN